MAFVVGVLKAANNRRRGAYHLGQLALGEAGFGSQLVYFPCYLVVNSGFFQRGKPFGPSLVVAAVQDFHSVGGRFAFAGHNQFSSNVCRLGLCSKRCLAATARSISLGGTLFSLTRPCDTTAA